MICPGAVEVLVFNEPRDRAAEVPGRTLIRHSPQITDVRLTRRGDGRGRPGGRPAACRHDPVTGRLHDSDARAIDSYCGRRARASTTRRPTRAFVDELKADLPPNIRVVERDTRHQRPGFRHRGGRDADRPDAKPKSRRQRDSPAMAKRYTREEFLARLRAEIARGRPLVMTGAGSGICAKFIERGGVDILGVYNTGYFRMQGYGSLAGMLPMADANELVYRDGPSARCCRRCARRRWSPGVNGVDPLRDMRLFLEDCRGSASRGVHNFPTVAWFDGEFRKTLEATGLGYGHELDMLNAARELDMLTIGYAFNAEDTERLMREAAPDIYIFHAGITAGGATGYARRPLARGDGRPQPGALRHRPADQARRDPAGPRRGAGRPGRRAVHARPHRLPRRAARLEHRAAWRSSSRSQERAAAFKAIRFP